MEKPIALIVEDDRDIVALFRHVLDLAGYRTEIVLDGKVAKILSPIAGTVSAVNRDVEESPDLIWRDPYRRGWLLMVRPDQQEEISRLYSGDQAKTWFMRQAADLADRLIEWAPRSSKKGDSPDGDLVGKIVGEKWDKLAEILLKH